MPGVEINCPACGEETLLRREPVYEGFTKTGESLSCSACGHTFASEEDVPYKQARKVEVFTEADRSEDVDVFGEEKNVRNCRRCRHYVVNPWTQRCGLRDIDVQATDVCDKFAAAEPEDNEPADPLAGLFKD